MTLFIREISPIAIANRALTCESLEDGDVLETLEVVDEDIWDPEIVEELQTDRVPELWLYRVVRPDPATSLVMRTDISIDTAGCCQIAPPDLCSKWGGLPSTSLGRDRIWLHPAVFTLWLSRDQAHQ